MALPKKKTANFVEIKKHVNAIHCSNNISLVQRKIFNALLFNAYDDLIKKSEYEIPVKYLSELIGYDSNDTKKLKNSLLGLITTAVEWNVLDHTNNDLTKWSASSIIAAAKIEKGICTYEFSSVMRELLYRPEMYGKIDLHVMTQFKSGYGLALYENCIRFQGLNNTSWLPLGTFRKLMGIPDNKYLAYCDFKKRVLDIALKEVNQHTPLTIVPEIKRLNRKPVSIRFKLDMKQTEMIHVEHFNGSVNAEIMKILSEEFGLSLEYGEKILVEYEAEFIKEKIVLVKSSANFKQGKIRDLAAYLIDALKRDYKKSKSSRDLIVINQQQRIEDELKEKRKIQEEQESYNSYVNDKIDKFVEELTATKKNKVFLQFEQNCDPYILTRYKKQGLKNKSVKAVFNMFIKDKHLRILDFDAFLKNK